MISVRKNSMSFYPDEFSFLLDQMDINIAQKDEVLKRLQRSINIFADLDFSEDSMISNDACPHRELFDQLF